MAGLKSLYEQVGKCVREAVNVNGCLLYPLLFSIYMDKLVSKVNERKNWRVIEIFDQNQRDLLPSHLLFACG